MVAFLFEKNMNWNISTLPTTIALSLAEAKRHLQIDASNDYYDDTIDDYLKAAAEHLFTTYNVSGGDLSVTADVESWSDFVLQMEHVASITSIKYYQPGSAVLTTLDPANYRLYNTTFPAKIEILSEPSVDDRDDAIQIILQLGFSVVPEGLKQALRLIVGDMWLARQTNHIGPLTKYSGATMDAISQISRRVDI